MPIEIDEVLRRSEQGATEPYICRGANGKLYFVKGKGAGYDSLVKEWIAGQLAKAMGLPIPNFEIVSVSQDLYDAGRNGPLRDLGFGFFSDPRTSRMQMRCRCRISSKHRVS